MLLPKNVTFAYLFSENESAYRQKKQKKVCNMANQNFNSWKQIYLSKVCCTSSINFFSEFKIIS